MLFTPAVMVRLIADACMDVVRRILSLSQLSGQGHGRACYPLQLSTHSTSGARMALASKTHISPTAVVQYNACKAHDVPALLAIYADLAGQAFSVAGASTLHGG
jgi:hypothetical protein